jgi:putative (di)nucleoside polyphosphate hydrolase
VWNNIPFRPVISADKKVIDADGFRPNVGIILANDEGRLLWARRIGQDAWQFPQGGISAGETPEEALYRELQEEVGLTPDAVQVMACTRGWLRYRLPKRYIRKGQKPLCIGQKQKWFLLHLRAGDDAVRVDENPKPEFDQWRWVSYWYPLTQVISFKREVYRSALRELAAPCGKLSASRGG